MFILYLSYQLTCPQNQFISNGTCINCPVDATNDPQNPYNCLCPTNKYFDSSINLCSSCISAVSSNNQGCVCNPGYTYDYILKVCKENCPSDSYRYIGSCKQCPTGTTQNQNNGSLCACNNTQYFDPLQGICIDCPANSTVDINNRCICNIIDYLPINGVCQLVCGGQYVQYQNQCQLCPNNSIRFNDSICQCQNNQTTNLYYNQLLNQCLECPSGTQQSTSTCVCQYQNYTFNLQTQQCEQQCPAGYYSYNTTNCVVCPQNALKCENNTVFCQNFQILRRSTSSCAFDFSWVIITTVFLLFFTAGMIVNLIGATSQLSYLKENAMAPEYQNGAPQKIKIKRSYYKQPKIKKERFKNDGNCCQQCLLLCQAKAKDDQRGCRDCCIRCSESCSDLSTRQRERNRECAERCRRCCTADSCKSFFKEKCCAGCHCGCLCCCEACL